MGLYEIFGSYAGWFLIFIIVFLILFFLIIAIVLAKKKDVDLICLERIKEISPDETATFEVTIHNPSKKSLNYEIKSSIDPSISNNWNVSLDITEITVESKQKQKSNTHCQTNRLC